MYGQKHRADTGALPGERRKVPPASEHQGSGDSGANGRGTGESCSCDQGGGPVHPALVEPPATQHSTTQHSTAPHSTQTDL